MLVFIVELRGSFRIFFMPIELHIFLYVQCMVINNIDNVITLIIFDQMIHGFTWIL